MKHMELNAAKENMELRVEYERQQAEYESKHALQIEALQVAATKMEKDLKNAEKKFVEDAGDPDAYDSVQDTIYQAFFVEGGDIGASSKDGKTERGRVRLERGGQVILDQWLSRQESRRSGVHRLH